MLTLLLLARSMIDDILAAVGKVDTCCHSRSLLLLVQLDITCPAV